jgi:hypothetical protein
MVYTVSEQPHPVFVQQPANGRDGMQAMWYQRQLTLLHPARVPHSDPPPGRLSWRLRHLPQPGPLWEAAHSALCPLP